MNANAVRRTSSVGLSFLVLYLLMFQVVSMAVSQAGPDPQVILQEHRTLLPLVMQILAPPPPAGGLVNGDFEAGTLGWLEYSELGYRLILTSNELAVAPHSGSWAAWLGGDNDELSVLEQTFTVPGSATRLSYYLWIASSDVCSTEYDMAGVIMDADDNPTGDDVLDAYPLCDQTSTGGWLRRELDISRYAGQTVALAFLVSTDSSINSNFFLDDVSLDTAPLQPATVPTQTELSMDQSGKGPGAMATLGADAPSQLLEILVREVGR